jgi:uncharacterized membrane protein YfcA
MLFTAVIMATLATSLVSGVLSMAGGMILMGVLCLLLSIPAAMVLHGVAQAASNGSRIWLYSEHICWSILLPYSIGALGTLALFSWVSFVPDAALVFVLIGAFPFISLLLPARMHLDISRPSTALFCGLLVTGVQMLAGASGPVLDIFYVNSTLSRQQILGTKAITQTLGHIIKCGYYALVLNLGLELPLAVYAGAVIAAVLGNWLGSHIVTRINDDHFKRMGRYVILIIGAVYIAKGITAYL